MSTLEGLLLRVPRGLVSRLRLMLYRLLGMRQGRRNRMESGRVRRCRQIVLGDYNAFAQGCWLWPHDTPHDGVRIRIGNGNYFNRNVMLDAGLSIEVGDSNMFGPDIYITDGNHRRAPGRSPKDLAMDFAPVRIGNNCWIGAKAVVLKGVELGDGCTVAAGAVVTRSVAAGQTVAGVPAVPIAHGGK